MEGKDRLLRRLAIPLGLLVAVVAVGVLGYMALEGWSFVDALYMTVITFTTVGFREVRDLDTGGRIFTMALLLASVGLALVSVAIAAQWWMSDTSRRAYGRRRMQKQIDGMRDHFILCAYGRVGRAVARELERAGVPFVVLDPNDLLLERLEGDGVIFLAADPTEEGILRAAGVDRARALVSAVDSDATNVYITLTARSLAPDLFIVARASEPGSEARLRTAGADRVISPFVSSGRHMALVALTPRAADVLELDGRGTGALQVEEFRVDAASQLVGRMLRDALPNLPVVAVRHADGTVTPNPDPGLELEDGDLVLTLTRDALGSLRSRG